MGNREPHFVGNNRSRKVSTRCPVVELDALDVLYGGYEVSGVKTKMIVAILDGEIGQPARALPIHRRIAAVDNVNLAQRVRIHSHGKRAAIRLADNKAICIILDLLRAGAGDVDLPG